MKTIYQFGFKFFTPPIDVTVLDCREITNPYRRNTADDVLRDLVRQAPNYLQVIAKGEQLLKNTDTIYVGCSFGKHRSWVVAKDLAEKTGATVTHIERNNW